MSDSAIIEVLDELLDDNRRDIDGLVATLDREITEQERSLAALREALVQQPGMPFRTNGRSLGLEYHARGRRIDSLVDRLRMADANAERLEHVARRVAR